MNGVRAVHRYLIPTNAARSETAVLLLGLLALDYFLVASGLYVPPFLLGHLFLYLGIVGWLVHRLHQQQDSKPWSLALGLILLPTGVGSMLGVAVMASLRGPLLGVLLGGTLWMWIADMRGQTTPYAAITVTAIGLAVTLGAFSPLNIGSSLMGTPPGVPVAIEVSLTADVFVFGMKTPALVVSRPGYGATVYLLPALIGLLAYYLGRRGTPSSRARSGRDCQSSVNVH